MTTPRDGLFHTLNMFTHIFRILPTPKFQNNIFKDARISKPSPLPPLPKIKLIKKMSLVMHKYIERIINVESDDNCGFRVVLGLLGKREEDHQFVRHHLIQEMTRHRESYTELYRNKENYDTLLNALVPCLSGRTPFDKCSAS